MSIVDKKKDRKRNIVSAKVGIYGLFIFAVYMIPLTIFYSFPVSSSVKFSHLLNFFIFS